jgi:hypothetical protein
MEMSLTFSAWISRFAVLAFLLIFSASAVAQKPASITSSSAATAEIRTAHALDLARTDPLNLYAFLARMPKGADLHVHLATQPKTVSAWTSRPTPSSNPAP